MWVILKARTTVATRKEPISSTYTIHSIQKRREFRNYLRTDDIDKAQSSSLKKGITTVRATNPLVPRYKMLGETEIKAAIPYPQ